MSAKASAPKAPTRSKRSANAKAPAKAPVRSSADPPGKKPPIRPTSSGPPKTSTPAPSASSAVVRFAAPAKMRGQRTVIYGPGGIGKTTLAAMGPGPVAYYDLDESLPVLASQLAEYNPQVVEGADDWSAMRASLQGSGWDDIGTIVVDSGTRAEEWGAEFVIGTIRNKSGELVDRIEGFGWGRGYAFIYDEYVKLLSDLDRHVREGRQVVIICHDDVCEVPNPQGENWRRYEPRLQTGKHDVRRRVREWSDHLLFIGYDVEVKKRGSKVGVGTGTRTIWPIERPHCMAKSRTMSEAIPYQLDSCDLWDRLLGL